MLIRILFYSLFFICITNTQAQVPSDTLGRIVWEKSEYEFGNIEEKDGQVQGIFYFYNTGKIPVTLEQVNTSCGCTSADYSREPILPNKSGFIKVLFDPTKRSGEFTKSITVKANTVPYYHLLSIHGKIIPRPQGPADWYPNKFGNIRMSTNHFSFDKIKTNQSKTSATKIYNDCSQPIKLLGFEGPSFIKFSPSKLEVLPGETIELLATINGKEINDWGFIFLECKMNTTDSTNPSTTIYLSGEVEEHFPDTSQKFMKKAPQAMFDKTTHDFGTISQSNHVGTKFEIKNTGKTPLIIRKAKADCGCTVPKIEKEIIKPGETSFIDVVFNPSGKSGITSKSVQIITNDPRKPMTILTIKANVESR